MPSPITSLLPLLLSIFLVVVPIASGQQSRCNGNSPDDTPYYEGPFLLWEGSCEPGKWLVISNSTGDTVCVDFCPEGKALMEGRCRNIEDIVSRACPRGMEHVINYHGEAECQCFEDHVFHEPSAECHRPYTQGPCSKGQSLQMVTAPEEGGRFECADSFCEEGQIAMTTSCEQVHAWSRHLHSNYTCTKICTRVRIDDCLDGVPPCNGVYSLQFSYAKMQYECLPSNIGGGFGGPLLLPQLQEAECPEGHQWAHGSCQKIYQDLPRRVLRNRPGGKRRGGFLFKARRDTRVQKRSIWRPEEHSNCPEGQEWAHGACEKIYHSLPRRNRPGSKRRGGFLSRVRRDTRVEKRSIWRPEEDSNCPEGLVWVYGGCFKTLRRLPNSNCTEGQEWVHGACQKRRRLPNRRKPGWVRQKRSGIPF